MWYAVSQNGQDVEKVYYAYHAGGHADQIIRKAAGDAMCYRTDFLYDKQGRTWMVVKDQWQLDGQTGEPINAQRTWAREFRYAGSGRQRYLTRARDPATLLPASAADGLWSDYDGEGVYCDYGVDVGTGTAEGTTLMQYEPGVWQRDAADPEMPLDYYFHGDLIGSTRAMSDGEGSAVQRVIYTAFGERVYASGGAGVPPTSRYGYAGTWGYEGGGVWGDENELPYLHVGERLYDPATGRFLQRDPIGIRGSLNVYAHLNDNPTGSTDPSGMDRWIEKKVHWACVYGNDCIGYWRIEIGMHVPRWGLWWHWPKDLVELGIRAIGAGTVAGDGIVTKTQLSGRPATPPLYVTAVEEDKLLHDKYRDGDHVYYSLAFRNCQHFAERASRYGTGH